MLLLTGLASQLGLGVLAMIYAVWSTRSGKILVAAGAGIALLWFAADRTLDRAYDRGVAEATAGQEADRDMAISGAKAEGEVLAVEAENAAAAEQAELKKLELLQVKVRDDAKTPDRVVLPADDAWLRSKRN